ncbi:hypothetical protein OIDMADRAFT_138373 [Oidiodendron maius Zn]|uniref:Uncharacterized protein n=1 Tax=Oidiodendron maius (strain Zn) TaxID=913774 RepID=A0A0C3GP16_OIDMZ|nr:hypothetical protein OIDMADRAFT_138373 [Oidiodendron maius Zn]
MKIEVPRIYWSILYTNMLASLFTWLLLAGFMVLPVTFSSLRTSRALNGLGITGKIVISAVQNIPFLAIAASCFVCGVAGLLWIWWENRRNYIWLTDRVFLPTLLNSFIGLITTLVNVYTTQGGHWSVTAIITAAITASITLFTVVPYMLYTMWVEQAWKAHCEMNRAYVG